MGVEPRLFSAIPIIAGLVRLIQANDLNYIS
jgi:hypothetical protein